MKSRSGRCAGGAGIETIVLALSAPYDGIRSTAARCTWKLSRNNTNKCSLYHAGAVPPLITMLRAESQAERAPAMAALWNLSLRSNRCEEIRLQMLQCEILPALAAMAELTSNAMVTDSDAPLTSCSCVFLRLLAAVLDIVTCHALASYTRTSRRLPPLNLWYR